MDVTLKDDIIDMKGWAFDLLHKCTWAYTKPVPFLGFIFVRIEQDKKLQENGITS